MKRQPYFIEDYILHRVIKEQDHQYETVVIPRALIPWILHAAHDLLGHNGIGRTYAIIKQLVLLERYESISYKAHKKLL